MGDARTRQLEQRQTLQQQRTRPNLGVATKRVRHDRSLRMKRLMWSASHGLTLSIAALLLATVSGKSLAIELVYGSGWPKEHVQVGVVADEWFKRIDKATDGRVKFRHVAGGTLLKPEAILDGVRKGVADCG